MSRIEEIQEQLAALEAAVDGIQQQLAARREIARVIAAGETGTDAYPRPRLRLIGGGAVTP